MKRNSTIVILYTAKSFVEVHIYKKDKTPSKKEKNNTVEETQRITL